MLLKPSTGIFFWSFTFLFLLYPFKYVPVIPVVNSKIIIITFILIFFIAIFLKYIEDHRINKIDKYSIIKLTKIQIQFIKWVTYTSLAISLSMLVYVVLVAIFGSGFTITGARNAVNSYLPEFGRILMHIRMIAIPGIVLLGTLALFKKSNEIIIMYIIFSVIYSALLGERLFLIETIVIVIVSKEILGYRVITKKVAIIGFVIFLGFFFLVEFLKRYFHKSITWDISGINITVELRFITERLFSYYADPSNKFFFALSENLGRGGYGWFNQSIGKYIERLYNLVSFGGNSVNNIYWSQGFGNNTLTNTGGFTSFYWDFYLAAPFLILGYIMVSSIIYFEAKKGNLVAYFIYPVIVVSIYEFPRVAYLYWPRFWLPIILVLFTFLFFSSIRKK